MRVGCAIAVLCAACDGVLGLSPITPAQPPDFTVLDGVQWQLPCGMSRGDNTCMCSSAPINLEVAVMGSGRFVLHVHVQAAVEAMAYAGGTPGNGGWYVGGTPTNMLSTIVKLDVSNPEQTYYINNGTGAAQVLRFDYLADVMIELPTNLVFTIESQDNIEAENREGGLGGTPITFAGVVTSPNPYNGEFGHFAVDSATPTP